MFKLGRYKLKNGQIADVTSRDKLGLNGRLQLQRIFWNFKGESLVTPDWDLTQLLYSTERDKCLCGGVGCNSCEPQGRG